jgi:hypothetical protein
MPKDEQAPSPDPEVSPVSSPDAEEKHKKTDPLQDAPAATVFGLLRYGTSADIALVVIGVTVALGNGAMYVVRDSVVCVNTERGCRPLRAAVWPTL